MSTYPWFYFYNNGIEISQLPRYSDALVIFYYSIYKFQIASRSIFCMGYLVSAVGHGKKLL